MYYCKGHSVAVTPYTINFINCLETDQIQAYEILQFVPIPKKCWIFPSFECKFATPLFLQIICPLVSKSPHEKVPCLGEPPLQS